jgi:hypothetical protein
MKRGTEESAERRINNISPFHSPVFLQPSVFPILSLPEAKS